MHTLLHSTAKRNRLLYIYGSWNELPHQHIFYISSHQREFFTSIPTDFANLIIFARHTDFTVLIRLSIFKNLTIFRAFSCLTDFAIAIIFSVRTCFINFTDFFLHTDYIRLINFIITVISFSPALTGKFLFRLLRLYSSAFIFHRYFVFTYLTIL